MNYKHIEKCRISTHILHNKMVEYILRKIKISLLMEVLEWAKD